MDYRCKYPPTNERPDPRNTTPSRISVAPTTTTAFHPPAADLSKSNIKRTPKTLPDIDDPGGRLSGPVLAPGKPKNLFTLLLPERTAQKGRRRTDHD